LALCGLKVKVLVSSGPDTKILALAYRPKFWPLLHYIGLDLELLTSALRLKFWPHQAYGPKFWNFWAHLASIAKFWNQPHNKSLGLNLLASALKLKTLWPRLVLKVKRLASTSTSGFEGRGCDQNVEVKAADNATRLELRHIGLDFGLQIKANILILAKVS